jgi:hypothetical protein
MTAGAGATLTPLQFDAYANFINTPHLMHEIILPQPAAAMTTTAMELARGCRAPQRHLESS